VVEGPAGRAINCSDCGERVKLQQNRCLCWGAEIFLSIKCMAWKLALCCVAGHAERGSRGGGLAGSSERQVT
jgi:hypothetical protein